jgi:hypothetical protein
VDIILLDWTRMGSTYCVAGVVVQAGQTRVVRPLPARLRTAPARNVGWSAYLMDGHTRWEVFELVHPEPAAPLPPHCEDVWVRGLNPRRRLAAPAERRAALEATMLSPDRPLFGAALTRTATSAFCPPGSGARSLATVVVPASGVQFVLSSRPERPIPDVRVRLEALGFEGRILPLKDHFLLLRAEQAAPSPEGRLEFIKGAVRAMGDPVAVRVGLSRPYPPGAASPACWLMADGFFSLADPTP